MSNSIAPGSSVDVNIRVTALTTNPNVPVTYKTIILKKNLVNGVNILTQEMISATNTKYVIKYDYVLGADIDVPENCIFEFDGGSISASGSNDTITGTNTGINAGLVKIFNTNITLSGTWNVTEAYPEWFGAKGDGITNDASFIQKTVTYFKTIKLTKHYIVNNPVLFSGLNNRTIIGSEDSLIESTAVNTIFYALSSSNVTFNGLNFEGNKQSDRTYTWPLEENAAIIFNSYSNNNVINGCKVKNFYYGVCLGTDYSSNNVIKDNIFENNNKDIDTYGTPVIIKGNISRGCTDMSIQIESYSLDQDIEDYRDYSTRPISVCSRVVDNTIMDCQNVGITICSGAYSTIVSRNTIINYHTYAISVKENTYGIIVSDNIIKNFAGQESTSVDSRPVDEVSAIINAAVDSKIHNNLIIGAQNGLYNKNVNSIVSNNVIVDSLHCGIVADKGKFISNYIRDAGCSPNGWWGYGGVYIFNSSSDIIFDDLTVIATDKAVKKTHGIFIENAYSPIIVNNSYFEGMKSSSINGNANVTNPKRMFGTGTVRPTLTSSDEGFAFFDKTTNIKKPIWWNGTAWVDATGTPV